LEAQLVKLIVALTKHAVPPWLLASNGAARDASLLLLLLLDLLDPVLRLLEAVYRYLRVLLTREVLRWRRCQADAEGLRLALSQDHLFVIHVVLLQEDLLLGSRLVVSSAEVAEELLLRVDALAPSASVHHQVS